jgi:micrococcal nuclease
VKKSLAIFAPILLIISLVFNFLQLSKPKPSQGYKVIEVQDGDSFVIEKSQKIRLLSVDAPDLELCNGKQSKAKLEELIKGKTVTLEEIVADRLRRIVALVYVDGELVNDQMAKAGAVKYNSIFSTEKRKIVEAEKYAKENKLGIFSQECTQTENLDNPKCNIKGNISRKSGGIYSFPGCSGYTNTIIDKYLGDEWFCSEKQALNAGFKKSGNCYDKEYQKP